VAYFFGPPCTIIKISTDCVHQHASAFHYRCKNHKYLESSAEKKQIGVRNAKRATQCIKHPYNQWSQNSLNEAPAETAVRVLKIHCRCM